MLYYRIEFSTGNTYKATAETHHNMQSRVWAFVKKQNAGETKSDRIKLLKLKTITKEAYDALVAPSTI